MGLAINASVFSTRRLALEALDAPVGSIGVGLDL